MEFLPPSLIFECMKAAPGDASQDGGLHKHLGRASPEHQPRFLILQGIVPWQVLLLVQIQRL